MNISSFSLLLLFHGLRRLLTHRQFSRKFSFGRSYTSPPTIREDRVALLNDDEGDASDFSKSSSRGQVLANDTNANSSEVDHPDPRDVESAFGIRETARLALEFGVLWVKTFFSSASFIIGLTLPAVFREYKLAADVC